MNILIIILFTVVCIMSRNKFSGEEEIDIQLSAYNFSVIHNSSIRGGHVYFKQPDISEIIKSVGKSVVERLINGYGKEANKTIIHESRTYSGLGNQVRSLVGSIAIALASGRKLRSNTIE